MQLETVKEYLGDTSWDDDTIDAALAAETAAQAKACRVPISTEALAFAEGDWTHYVPAAITPTYDWTRLHSTGANPGFGWAWVLPIQITSPLAYGDSVSLTFEYMRLSEDIASVSLFEQANLDAPVNTIATYTQTGLMDDDSLDGDWELYFQTLSNATSFDYLFRNVRFTSDSGYPADLAEALCRRVAHNLALRGLPLGLQANVSEGYVAQTRVGGTDAEVRRLEAPWRRLAVG